MPEPFRGVNSILSRLSAADYRLLEPHLENVKLPARRRLETPDKRIDHVFFLEQGLASAIAHGPGGRTIEIGLIGREGMSGVPIIMGADRSPHEVVMQIGGSAHCMRADNLKKRIAESRTLHAMLLCYAQSFMIQIGQTALANGRSKIEERVARWLLMAHDRLDGGGLPFTHEAIAGMLGVRRPGISVALTLLERAGHIHTDRRSLGIANRDGLIRAANGSYGIAEAEYERLFAKL